MIINVHEQVISIIACHVPLNTLNDNPENSQHFRLFRLLHLLAFKRFNIA